MNTHVILPQEKQHQLDLLLNKAPAQVHPFLTQSMVQLDEYQVEPLVADSLQVKFQEILCSGFFHHKPLQFAVALKKDFPDWFRIYVHEFSHFRQYVDNQAYFNAASDDIEVFFNWVAGKEELDEATLHRMGKIAMEIEHDCEARVLKLINQDKFENILEPGLYARKANAYVNFYHFVVENRKWYKAKQEPYNIEAVYNLFPDNLVILESLTPEMKEAFKMCVK
jgi:hypothetical protein